MIVLRVGRRSGVDWFRLWKPYVLLLIIYMECSFSLSRIFLEREKEEREKEGVFGVGD